MFRHVIWVDEYIIQIDHDTNIQKIRENVVHESLEGHRSIGKTKRHYRLLKWSITCPKGSLPFITISNANQVVSIVKIYLCIHPRWVQQIRNEWEWIVILFWNTIKTTDVKFTHGGLSFSISLFIFIFISVLFFYFSIFRTTRVMVDWSCCHISHNLMA